MTKRAHKPLCCWTAKATTWAVHHHDGRNTPIKRGPSPCAARACFDWPVCRGHLQAWANENPLEVVKRRPVGTARLHFTTKWDRVQMVFKVGGWRGYTVEVIVSGADALTLADWYDHNGDERSALVIRHPALELTMPPNDLRADALRSILVRLDELTRIHRETTSPQ